MNKKLIFFSIITMVTGVFILGKAFSINTISPASNLLSEERFITIAHRGASSYAPEHTIEAYKIANKMGADYIEIDLGMTRDGVLVGMHDDNVDRTTNGKGLVRSYNIIMRVLLKDPRSEQIYLKA